jgi:hypothetical protein
MINIHKKLWVAIKKNKDGLAYMTYYQKDSAFENRKSTGLNWSGIKEDEAEVYDNLPIQNFIIAESVSRWSTQNKLFRVIDPRGFTVEVPTGNISNLLKYTTVIKGVVQEECVWGREVNNHVLLPVGSEPYLKSKEDTKTNSEKISFSKLDEGNTVSMYIGGGNYRYLGKFKMKWSIKKRQGVKKLSGSGFYSYDRYCWIKSSSDEVLREEEFTDNKWRHLFKSSVGESYEHRASGKCIKKTGRGNTSIDLGTNLPIYQTSELSNFLDECGVSQYGFDYEGVYYEVAQCGNIKK